MDAPTEISRLRPHPAARWVLVGVLALAAVLAFAVRELLADRVVQSRSVAMIRAGAFAQALEEADLRLSRQPDDPRLVEVAVLAARSHVERLLEQKTPVGDVAAWLDAQLARRPYLRPALASRLAELQGEGAGAAPPGGRKKLGGAPERGE